MEDYVRVLRLVSYEGPRDKVEKQIERSIHGVKDWGSGVPVIVEKAEILDKAYSRGYTQGWDDRHLQDAALVETEETKDAEA